MCMVCLQMRLAKLRSAVNTTLQVGLLGSSLRVAHASRMIGFGGRALNRPDWQMSSILDAGASSGFKGASSKFVVI
jgi:hypothetical protein